MAYDLKYGVIHAEHGDRAHGEAGVPLNESDEPVIVFRAQDKLTVPLLARYENLYVASQPDSFDPDQDEFIQCVRSVRSAFENWQRANSDRVKLPD